MFKFNDEPDINYNPWTSSNKEATSNQWTAISNLLNSTWYKRISDQENSRRNEIHTIFNDYMYEDKYVFVTKKQASKMIEDLSLMMNNPSLPQIKHYSHSHNKCSEDYRQDYYLEYDEWAMETGDYPDPEY
jgi:hypothetical protein